MSREAAGAEAAAKVAALEQQCSKLETQKDALAASLRDGQAEIAGLQVPAYFATATRGNILTNFLECAPVEL